MDKIIKIFAYLIVFTFCLPWFVFSGLSYVFGALADLYEELLRLNSFKWLKDIVEKYL